MQKHRKVVAIRMSKRKRNTNKSVPEGVLKQKNYKVTLMSSTHTPPTMTYDIVAISPEEAFGKAISIANAHMQGSIMNNFMEMTGSAISSLLKGEDLSDELKEDLLNWSIDHDRFQVDGVMVVNSDRIQGEVLDNTEIREDIATEFEDYLKKMGDTDE